MRFSNIYIVSCVLFHFFVSSNLSSAFIFFLAASKRTKCIQPRQQQRQKHAYCTRMYLSNNPSSSDRDGVPIDKTYESYKKDIIIDHEGAMLSFFTSREEWLPLFRSVAGDEMPKDTTSLIHSITGSKSYKPLTDEDVHETSFPWKRYEAIPSNEEDRNVVARFLDSMQESLLAIPVVDDPNARILAMTTDDGSANDLEEDDENDIQFVEEGRRLLALNRFHVLSTCLRDSNNNYSNGMNGNDVNSSVESVDELFRHCWSEIYMLSQEGKENSGSLLLLPYEYKLSNLRRFVEMNVVQPLKWLGIYEDYEISSFQRDSPVIRMIYKLTDISSTASYTEEDGFASSS